MPISDNIKKLREIYGISQKELAEIAGVTDKAISTWESGVNVPRMGPIQKISDHFNIKKSNIIEDDGMNEVLFERTLSNKRSDEDSPTEKRIRVLARKADNLTEDDREQLLQHVESTIDLYLNAKGIKRG